MSKIVEYTLDGKTGKMTCTNFDTGITHDVDPEKMSTLIRGQLSVLEGYALDGRTPSEHLLKDIRTYQYILRQPDPDKTTSEYLTKKNEMLVAGKRIANYAVAEALGWKI